MPPLKGARPQGAQTARKRRSRKAPGRLLGPVERAREAEQSETRLLYALRAAEVGAFDWDVVHGNILYIDPYASGDHEYRAESVEESGQATHPDDRPMVRAAVERLIADRDATLDVVHRRFSPTKRQWVRVQIRARAVERDASGRALRILGIFRDVTLATEQAELAHRREMAVANAARLASLGEMAAVMGHELNQPLAALTTYVQALVRLVEQGATGHREIVVSLRRCGQLASRASEILRRVRGLVRRSVPQQEVFDVREAIAQVVPLLERAARQARVELHVGRTGTPVWVDGDRVAVEQALFNLGRNAIDAMEESGSRRRRALSFGAARRGAQVSVSVADSGPGIARKHVKRIFDPFFTTKPTGSGLGLAIARSVAEAHGGSLRLERNGPSGATFALRLPAGRVRHAARA